MLMSQIKMACRLTFWDLGKNHKKIPAQKFDFSQPTFEVRFYPCAYGTTRGVLNNLVGTVYTYIPEGYRIYRRSRGR